MDWNRTYSESKDFFGSEPDSVLVKFGHLFQRDMPVLDIGAGQGRNSLYLAEKGFRVVALDPSDVAMENLKLLAEGKGLPLKTRTGGFEDLLGEPQDFGTILAMGLIPILRREEVDLLGQLFRERVGAGGHVCLRAFTTNDPSFESCRKDRTAVGHNSFLASNGDIRTFLDPGEGQRLIPEFEILHHWEGIGPEHRHGDGPLHRNGWVELVGRKKPHS